MAPAPGARSRSAPPRRDSRSALLLGLAGGLAIVAAGVLAVALASPWSRPPAGSSGTTGSAATPGTLPPSAPASSGSNSASSAPLEFQPALLEGTGDRRVAFDIPDGAAAIAKVSNAGAGPFRLQAIGAGNTPGEVLVDTAGPYAGTLLFDALVDQHSVAFDVRSSGRWTVRVEPVGLAASWSGDVPLGGTGDDVALLDQAADGSTSVQIRHAGAGRIRVLAYTDSGELDQLVDAPGSIDETHTLPAGTVCVVVRAVGAWTLSPG